jgi:hypothetical protein
MVTCTMIGTLLIPADLLYDSTRILFLALEPIHLLTTWVRVLVVFVPVVERAYIHIIYLNNYYCTIVIATTSY